MTHRFAIGHIELYIYIYIAFDGLVLSLLSFPTKRKIKTATKNYISKINGNKDEARILYKYAHKVS